VLALMTGGAIGLALTLVVHWLIKRMAYKHAERLALEFADAVTQIDTACKTMTRRAEVDYQRRVAEGIRLRDDAKRKADDTFRPLIEQIVLRRKNELSEASEKYIRGKERITKWHKDALAGANEHFANVKNTTESQFTTGTAEADKIHLERTVEAKQ